MSEAITAYTTTDAIRGAIGITDNEVTDSMLVSQNLGLELENDLLQWLPDHGTLYAAGMTTGASAAEKMQAAQIVLYAQWYCAAQLVAAMVLGIPQSIADGKDEMKRFLSLDFEALTRVTAGRRDLYKAQLQTSIGVDEATATTIMSISNPDYDPVTNE